MTIASNEVVFVSWDFLQNIVSNFFDQHLFSTFHILDSNSPDRTVSVVLQSVFVLHDTCPALLIPHLHENRAKDRLGGVNWFRRDLSDCLDNISININTRGFDFRKDLLRNVKVSVTR